MRIKQGNTYDIELQLELEDGTAVTDENVAVVKLSLGRIMKKWPVEVAYSDGKFVMHLSQEETFSMSGVPVLRARVKTLTGDVANGDIGPVVVKKSDDKEIL